MWLDHIFYRIDKWLPSDWPELEEEPLRQAVEDLASWGRSWTGPVSSAELLGADRQHNVDLLRTACCLFWQLFYWPERYTAVQLQELRTAWQYEYKPDEPPDWVRAYVSIHLTGALALHLYKTEMGFSEALREAVDDITRMAAYLKSLDSLTGPGLYYVDDPQYFDETVPLRKSLPIVCSLGWCFSFYIAKEDGEPVKAFEDAFEAFDTADIGHAIHAFSAEPLAVIEQSDATFGLVSMWMRTQHIAEVFDEIHKLIDPKVDWVRLADRCEDMRFYSESARRWAEENRFLVDSFVRSEIGKFRSESGSEWAPSYPVSEFWTYARGLCVTRLSPDAYRKLRGDDERHAAEDRLKAYFFTDLWEEIPSEAQDALIAADQIYWATEGRKGDVLENLRLASEPILEERVAVPFRAWLAPQGKQTPVISQGARQEPFLRLSRLLNELWGPLGLFGEFARSVFPDIEGTFWRDLQATLRNLRDLRGATTHPEERGSATADQISECYRRFVGIGQPGVLPDLLRLAPRQSQSVDD